MPHHFRTASLVIFFNVRIVVRIRFIGKVARTIGNSVKTEIAFFYDIFVCTQDHNRGSRNRKLVYNKSRGRTTNFTFDLKLVFSDC